MFNIGIMELIVVLLIAFLIVGPKDLPKVARFLGKCVKWVRGLIAELKAESGWDDIMRETGDIRKDVDETMKQMNISRELNEARKELDRSLTGAKRAADTGSSHSFVQNSGNATEETIRNRDMTERTPGDEQNDMHTKMAPNAPRSWGMYKRNAEQKAAEGISLKPAEAAGQDVLSTPETAKEEGAFDGLTGGSADA